MSDAVCYLGWESYVNGPDGRGFFAQEPLSFNSRQGRLHKVSPGDHVWLVSRDPDNRQYYIVGVLRVAERRTNEPGGELATAYGGEEAFRGQESAVGEEGRGEPGGARRSQETRMPRHEPPLGLVLLSAAVLVLLSIGSALLFFVLLLQGRAMAGFATLGLGMVAFLLAVVLITKHGGSER